MGLLYDSEALDAAWDLVKDFSMAERHALRDGVPRHALKLPFRGATVRELALEALKIASEGAGSAATASTPPAPTRRCSWSLWWSSRWPMETPAERKLALATAPGRAAWIRCSRNSRTDMGIIKADWFRANDERIDALDHLLEQRAVPHGGYGLEQLDGFLSALVVSPGDTIEPRSGCRRCGARHRRAGKARPTKPPAANC